LSKFYIAAIKLLVWRLQSAFWFKGVVSSCGRLTLAWYEFSFSIWFYFKSWLL